MFCELLYQGSVIGLAHYRRITVPIINTDILVFFDMPAVAAVKFGQVIQDQQREVRVPVQVVYISCQNVPAALKVQVKEEA